MGKEAMSGVYGF